MSYHKVSSNYWDYGFHQRAFEVLEQALRVDSSFTPGLIFGMAYSIQLGDTARARWYFSRVQKADSNHAMIKPVRRIFSLIDSIRTAKTPSQRVSLELSLAKGYGGIGLRELTIEQSLAVLQEDPNNVGALEVLAQMYDEKNKRLPAMHMLERLVALKPDDRAARERLNELRSQF